ncbi:MAG: DMT family transporter [Bacteroidales bacterium]|nr:DMT family transporter [Bacteroidales bacterium]
MIYLILAIILSTAVFVVMRIFGRFNLDNHQALTWNYATSALIGTAMGLAKGTWATPSEQPWFGLTLILGFWFILTYVLIVESSQRSGVTITSLSSKLSVVIPTLFGILFLKEALGWTAGIGIVLALVALFLVVGGKDKAASKTSHATLGIAMLPVFIFLSTGIGDILMKMTEQKNTSSDMIPMIAFVYFISFLFGVALVAYDLIRKKSKWQWKSALGGLVLGTVNFFSTCCIYQAMRVFDNVVMFPVYNIGVVCLSALSGWLLFKEKLTWKNYLGLAIAIIAVILITVKL